MATREYDRTRWIFAFYLLLLVWVPIPLGSNRPWSSAVMEIWVLVLVMAWLTGFVRGRISAGPTLPHATPVLACMGAWVAYVWFQSIPLPIDMLRVLSPEAAHWHISAALGDDLAFAPIALDRHAAVEGACRTTAYFGFFVLGLALMRDRDRIRLATYVLISSGVVQALYGAYMSFQAAYGPASGTFINRNHFAAYLVMCLSVGVGVLMASLSGVPNHSWRQFFRRLIEWTISPRMALRLLLVTMVIGLVLTRSRMGNLSFFVGLLVAGTIGLVLSKKATRSMVILLVSLIAIDLLIVGTYFGSQRLVERIGETSLQTEDRDELAVYAYRMWLDFPVFGAGLGSFPAVIPRYSAEATPYAYTHAHNDFVELAAETGLAGLVPVGLAVVLSFGAALRAQYRRKDPVMRGISFAAIMGIVALMLHCTADFNLQIPANALTFTQLLAFAWVSLYCAGHTGEDA